MIIDQYTAEIRSVVTSSSVLVLEPESQLVPDSSLPEVVEVVVVGGLPLPPPTTHTDRQTAISQPDTQKESIQNGWKRSC